MILGLERHKFLLLVNMSGLLPDYDINLISICNILGRYLYETKLSSVAWTTEGITYSAEIVCSTTFRNIVTGCDTQFDRKERQAWLDMSACFMSTRLFYTQTMFSDRPTLLISDLIGCTIEEANRIIPLGVKTNLLSADESSLNQISLVIRDGKVIDAYLGVLHEPFFPTIIGFNINSENL